MTTRIDTLGLQNFRLFRELSITFHPELTVLVAPNGGGKTAILDALRIALQAIVKPLGDTASDIAWSAKDTRLLRTAEGAMAEASEASLRVRGVLDEQPVAWKFEYAAGTLQPHITEVFVEAIRLRGAIDRYADGKRSEAPSMPVFAYYGTGRLWVRNEPRRTRKKTESREEILLTGGYLDCLTSASRYDRFIRWFERVIREAQNELTSRTPSPHRPQLLLAAIRTAVDAVLRPSGWHTLDWDFLTNEIIAAHTDHGRLPVGILSDGIRNLIGLVADLAQRAVQLNPHLGADAPKMSSGIVLIDEVDMHLHPEWQQLVVGQLREAFPRIQFIVTTHSPQVLSTVDKESIRILRMRDGIATVETPKFQTRGVESADVLAFIMGVDPVPQVAEASWLSNYRALIEDNEAESTEALALRARLVAHFGPSHPVIIDCERLIRFQSFKVRRTRPEGT